MNRFTHAQNLPSNPPDHHDDQRRNRDLKPLLHRGSIKSVRQKDQKFPVTNFCSKIKPTSAGPPLISPFTFQPSTNINKMSHFTEIKTQIKDIVALRLACQEMGLTLLQNTEARGYYENKIRGDYVVQLKGPYDIALNKQPDGTFGLTADIWNGHVEKEVGQGYGKLLKLYGVHKATIEARKRGLSVLRRQQQNGSIKLVLMGVS